MILSTWDQAEAMRRGWATFKILKRNRQCALWEGIVQPLSQTYTVQVFLRQDQSRKKTAYAQIPLVTVTRFRTHNQKMTVAAIQMAL